MGVPCLARLERLCALQRGQSVGCSRVQQCFMHEPGKGRAVRRGASTSRMRWALRSFTSRPERGRAEAKVDDPGGSHERGAGAAVPDPRTLGKAPPPYILMRVKATLLPNEQVAARAFKGATVCRGVQTNLAQRPNKNGHRTLRRSTDITKRNHKRSIRGCSACPGEKGP